MQEHELRPPRGAKKPRKRIGRGNASGHGTYAGKGLKGQQSRSGYKVRPGFEGGQTPLIRRLPRRRGFLNPFRIAYTPVNLRDLVRLPGSEVTPDSLRDAGIVRTLRRPIKLLGTGDVIAALTVHAHRVSSAARAKIEAAGGTVEELTPRAPKRERKTKAKRAEQPKAEMTEEAPAPEAEANEVEEERDSGSESPATG